MDKDVIQIKDRSSSSTLSLKSTQYCSPKCFSSLPIKKHIVEDHSTPFYIMLKEFDNALASIELEEETFESSSNIADLSCYWDEKSQLEEMSDFIL